MHRISIRAKLPLIMVALTVTAIAMMGSSAYLSARGLISDESRARLSALGDLQARSVQDFFAAIDRDLTILAETPDTREALLSFAAAFRATENAEAELQRIYIDENPHPLGAKDKLVSAGGGSAYDLVHARYHPQFDRLQDAHGYYDVFLFDVEGNLIYSVFKERDYATNMISGEWRDSGLAQVFRRAINTSPGDASVFEDFAPYGPSYGAPASFIARPVLNERGRAVGVLAYQMPIDAINTAVRTSSGLGTTGDAYLVGADGYLRTDALTTPEDDILTTRADNEAVLAALRGEKALGVHAVDGVESLFSAAPFEFLGTTWAIVLKEDVVELNAPLVALLRTYLLNGAILVAAALALSLLTSRSISRPLGATGAAMREVAARRFETAIPGISRGDEIGEIARTLEGFRKSLLDAEGVAREAAFKGAGFEVSGAPMLMTNTDLTILYSNLAMTRMIHERTADFRKAVPEFDGKTLIGRDLDVFPFPTGPMRERFAAGAKLPIKEKVRVGDAYLGLLVDAVNDREGRPLGYVIEWRDQTNQMRSEVVQRAIDARQVRVELRLDGKVERTNDVFLKMLGAQGAGMSGASGTDMIALADPGPKSQSIWDQAKAGSAVFDVFRIRHAGVERLVEGSLNPVPDERGATSGFLLLGVDVTEQRAGVAEAEARRARMVAEQRQVVESLAAALGRLADGDVTARMETPLPEDYEELRHDFNRALEALEGALARSSPTRV